MMKDHIFKDSNGVEYHSNDPRLVKAMNTVADQWLTNALRLRRGDEYPSCVTEIEKNAALLQSIDDVAEIRSGASNHCFAIWQRVNVELTGKHVRVFELIGV